MKRLNRFAVLFFALAAFPSCRLFGSSEPGPTFAEVREKYFRQFLAWNPVACTYLGGDSYSTDLAHMSGKLRDWSPAAIAKENEYYKETLAILEDFAELTPDETIDRDVIAAQMRFMIRLSEVRKHHLRCVETYTTEPARGVDWAIQGMTARPDGGVGVLGEWQDLVTRVQAIPRYLAVASTNLEAGANAGIVADARMIERDGIAIADANAKYFALDLPKQAEGYLKGAPFADSTLAALRQAGNEAQRAYLLYKDALGRLPRKEGFSMGETEYNWALKNNLRLKESARELYDYSATKVAETQRLLFEVARRISEKRNLGLSFRSDEESFASARAVMNELGKDYPKDDEQLLSWCRERAGALVEYARKHELFDLPSTYKLDIVETPPQLRSAVEAAYYPAPPFKKTGVGRFYITPTGNDPGLLKENNLHSLADLCAHEGFPGHDWNYQYMNAHADAISPVRWLTPGGVEDTCSMWEDSMAAEGWALYAEQLMSESQVEAPEGFYTPEERLYQLNWQLLRDVRVRVDTGIHLKLMSFDEAVDYFARNVGFVPDARAKASTDETAGAVFKTATSAIYRYSKWPTQAITYHMGKKAILELRADCSRITGAGFSPRRFHEIFMEQGTIPPGYFRERLISRAKEMVETR